MTIEFTRVGQLEAEEQPRLNDEGRVIGIARVAVQVYACGLCFSLVAGGDRDGHRDFHGLTEEEDPTAIERVERVPPLGAEPTRITSIPVK